MEFYNGKLVVGGNFTVISGQNRTRLAIINLNSTNLTTFSASLNNIPLCLSVLADTIFLGGKFTTVNSFGQEKLAKINAQTGALLGSLFQINGDVNTISVIDSDSIVIGGTFTIINNVSRKKIALVNYSGNSSAIYSWAPVIQVNNVNNIVYTSNISGGKIYVGGLLSKIGGKAVSNVFSLNTNQGQLLSWLPVINNVVMDIDFYANSLVIAGGFTSVNGITRHQLAFFDYPSGNLNNINYTVQGGMLNTIAISNNIIYLGGDFNSVNSVLRNKLGSINLITGNLTSWNYNPSHTVNCIIVANNMIFVGGNFGWLTANYLRYGLASFYESTGTISSWSPVLNDQPFEISAIGNELFVGGEFTEINGLKRNHIGSIYINSGQTTNWDPLATDIVRTVCTQNNKIFVGGDFLSVGGRWVNNITVLDENTGFAQPWNPDIGGVVYCIKRLNNQVFIGGDFTVVGNIPTLNLASVDAISGALNTWFPETDQMVMTMDLSNTGLIIGGFFTSVGGISRQNIAAINTSNGNILGWYPILDGFVQSIKVKGNSVYTIGGFLNVNGSPRSGFASIDAITGILNSLDAGLLGESATFDIKNNIVYLVEESIPPYTTQGVNVRLIDASSGISTSWPIDLNNYVYAVAEFGNQVFVGGQYMVVENIFSPGIAAFDPVNGNLSSWNANIQPTSSIPYSRIVRDLKTSENQIYLGGHFGGLIGEKITNFAVLSDCLPNTGTNILSACDSLTWINGITYYSSNYTDTYTLTNSDGCDSIVTLNLTISYTTNTVDTHIACDSFTWINGNTYNISNNTDTIILSSSAGCDSIITLDLTILSSSMGTDVQIACDSYTWIDGITYFNSTNSPIYSISNSVGCDSIINLNLTIIQNELLDINIFSSPSDSINCNGALAFSLLGNPNFIIELDNGAQQDTTTMNSVFVNICPGIHSLVITDGCSDIDTVVAIVPIDSNYIYVNAFLDSLILDSLGTTFSNCTIYYNSIDTAYIDSIWNVGNIVNVVWNIVDSTGSNYDTSTYILNNGNGTYLLQLNIFCPTENENNFFTVTQAVYFNDGIIYTNGLQNDEIEKIVIYPNPTEGILNVSSNNIINSINLFDLNGKMILKNTFYKSDVNIDLREMSPGIYLLKVHTNNLSETYKVILH